MNERQIADKIVELAKAYVAKPNRPTRRMTEYIAKQLRLDVAKVREIKSRYHLNERFKRSRPEWTGTPSRSTVWTTKEDRRLVLYFRDGASPRTIAEAFRHRSADAIISRARTLHLRWKREGFVNVTAAARELGICTVTLTHSLAAKLGVALVAMPTRKSLVINEGRKSRSLFVDLKDLRAKYEAYLAEQAATYTIADVARAVRLSYDYTVERLKVLGLHETTGHRRRKLSKDAFETLVRAVEADRVRRRSRRPRRERARDARRVHQP